MKGMRQAKSTKSTKERLKELEVSAQNSSMALQMSQMMVKHLTNQIQALQADVTGVMGMSNDFQYRTLAMLELGSFDKDAINVHADKLKLDDFNKASDKEDLAKGYEVDSGDTIKEESIVIMTSSTPGVKDDMGIFRSKFAMSECQTPELREKLLGSKINDVIEIEIQDVKHVITVLGLRLQKEVAAVVEEVEKSKEG
ncbi:MAG: hypothetical protein ACTSU6_04005 [Candidatus Njordarchaeales archaeon]